MKSDFSMLVPVLSDLLERAGHSPIRLEVALCDSDELREYKDKCLELEAEIERLKTEYHRTEYLFRCESIVNMRLTDFCREHHLEIPNSLFKR